MATKVAPPSTEEEALAKTVYKTFRAEVKKVDAEAGLVHLDIPMSTDSVDRDGEIVEPRGFRKHLGEFNKRPILVSSHNYGDLRKQIGEFVGLKITDRGLVPDAVKYYIGAGNEEADWGFYLASKGVAAFSIGFIPIKWEAIDPDDDGFMAPRRYTEQELLEISQVVVPSNRDAMQTLRSKAANDPVVTGMLDELEQKLEPEGQEGGLVPPGAETLAVVGQKVTITEELLAETALSLGEVLKPYPNEHACRLKDPGQYDECKRGKRTAGEGPGEGKPYSIIFCKKGDGPMEEQAYRYDKEVWEASEARAHCKAHDGTFEAAAPKAPREVTQGELQDELDFCISSIEKVSNLGNTETKETALALASAIITRVTGSDIPDDILTKVGAVLNAKNMELLQTAKANIEKVLASAEKPEADDQDGKAVEPPGPPETKTIAPEYVAEITKMVLARLTGKRIYK